MKKERMRKNVKKRNEKQANFSCIFYLRLFFLGKNEKNLTATTFAPTRTSIISIHQSNINRKRRIFFSSRSSSPFLVFPRNRVEWREGARKEGGITKKEFIDNITRLRMIFNVNFNGSKAFNVELSFVWFQLQYYSTPLALSRSLTALFLFFSPPAKN